MGLTGFDYDRERTQRKIAEALEQQNELRQQHNELMDGQNKVLSRIATMLERIVERVAQRL